VNRWARLFNAPTRAPPAPRRTGRCSSAHPFTSAGHRRNL